MEWIQLLVVLATFSSLWATEESRMTFVYEKVAKGAGSTGNPLPAVLHVFFKVAGHHLDLALRREYGVDVNAPAYFATKTGKYRAKETKITNVGMYTSKEHGGAFAVEAESGSKKLTGNFVLKGKEYGIEAVSKKIADLSAILTKALHMNEQGTLHTVYELQSLDLQGQGKSRGSDISLKLPASGASTLSHHVRPISDAKMTPDVIKYYVKIMFVIDHTIWEYWMKRTGDESEALRQMKIHKTQTMLGIRAAYHNIDKDKWGIQITTLLGEFQIFKTEADNPIYDSSMMVVPAQGDKRAKVDADKIIIKMEEWSNADGRGWGNPDHAMYLTRYNIYRFDGSESLDLLGVANYAGVCVPKFATSVTEETGMNSFRIAAHELAHNLGVEDHDGDGVAASCPDGYLMGSEKFENSERGINWQFSSCSIEQIKPVLAGRSRVYPGYIRTCLLAKVCSFPVFQVMPGVEFDTKEQCQMLTSRQSSTPCGDINDPFYCKGLHCTGEDGGCPQTYFNEPFDGTPCGPQQWCRTGECAIKSDIYTPLAPMCFGLDMKNQIPTGCEDTSNQASCDSQVRDAPHGCFAADQGGCCASCHRAALYDPFSTTAQICPDEKSQCVGLDEFKCIWNNWFCDGADDCGNNYDEQNCPATTPRVSCPDGYSQCVGLDTFKCIYDAWFCDGVDDCGNNYDEQNCPATTPADVKSRDRGLLKLLESYLKKSTE